MKKRYFAIKICAVALATLPLWSCSDFLDTESPSQQGNDVVYENIGMTKSAVIGIYSQMLDSYAFGQKIPVNWQGCSDIEIPTGFSDTDYSTSGDKGASNFYDDVYNKTTPWKSLFKMGELASTAVEGIRNSTLLSDPSSEKEMKMYLGEALVLRSLAYFELVRRWGDIPYKDTSSKSDLSNVYMKKIDRDLIYADLIKNLQEAVEYLPWLGESTDYNCERVTKGYAYGLLARVALHAGGWSVRDGNTFDSSNVEKYQSTGDDGMAEENGYYVGRPKNWKEYYLIAEDACAKMIGDPSNPHQLDPNYGDIWKTVCHLDYNKYNENLFEIAFGMGQSGDIGTLMGYNVAGTPTVNKNGRGFGGNYVTTTGYYFYSFDPADTRRDYECSLPSYKLNKQSVEQEELGNSMMGIPSGKWNFFWTSDDFKSLWYTANSRIPTGINWIMMRYPDVLLMFAEAANGLGENVDAVNETAKMSPRQALEKVRERAFGTGSLKVKEYDQDFFNAIVNERAWEFGCEGVRKFDLIRWGLLDSKIEDMKKSLCLMLDGTQPVKIFDKTYQPEEFPDTVYVKYQTGANTKFLDLSSANFYEHVAKNPDPSKYTAVAWFPTASARENPDVAPDNKVRTTLVSNCVKVLLNATGLRARYDYSSFYPNLAWGSEVESSFLTKKAGNGKCNYRHFFAIKYEDLTESHGYLSNAYGY